MATRRWQGGGATATAQVTTFAFAGTWEVGDIIRVTIGSRTWDYAVTSTTITTFLPLFVTAYNALSSTTYPEFAEITASSNSTTLTMTGDTAGVPFTVTLTPYESDGSTAADAQTIEGGGVATTGTVSTAATGPYHWNAAANWKEGVVPVSSDDVIIDDGGDIRYGLDQNAVTLTSLTITPNFLGKIGLPSNTDPNNPSGGYPQYRDQRLKIGATTATIDTVSQRVRLNLHTAQTTVTVNGTGNPDTTREPALDLVATHASSIVRINRGNVWIAGFAGDTSTLSEIEVAYQDNQPGDSTVKIGSGTTLTNLNQSGGQLTLECAVTTIVKTGGTLIRVGSGAVTTLRNRAGVVLDDGTGTITTLHNTGHYERRGLASLTITNCTVYRGSETWDVNSTVTWTNAPNFYECHPPLSSSNPGPSPAWVQFGTHRKITIADI